MLRTLNLSIVGITIFMIVWMLTHPLDEVGTSEKLFIGVWSLLLIVVALANMMNSISTETKDPDQ